MSSISQSRAALRIFGDDLVPDEISVLLGSRPTDSYSKGEVRHTSTGHVITRKTGMWKITAAPREPEDLDHQVHEVLSALSSDMAVWSTLNQKYQIDLFCGLFMEGSNEGCSLSVATMSALAARGIEVGFDIYAPDRPIDPSAPCPCESGKAYSQCCAPST
ncbi:DUF4279 domain-containing protein [Chiayiivirga flava]|uniref:DUF4279 domain-containing protein n=1 Tax=Chiayiivirga flava TaxID=659595 RepID=UPI001608795C